jgi:5'-nucleotidase
MGRDIPYSGTVMATLQGLFRNIPSVAVSLAIRDGSKEPDFSVAAAVAELLARRILSGSIPSDAILNTNVPDIPLEQIKGIVSTRTAPGGYVRLAEVRGEGSVSYATSRQTEGHPEGTDIWAVDHGMISITPVRIEVTDHARVPVLAEHMAALEGDLLAAGGVAEAGEDPTW